MTEECVNPQALQDDARKCSRGTAKHEEIDYYSDVEKVEERQGRDKMVSESLQTVDLEQQQHSRRRPALVRSKTFDHSLLTQVQTDPGPKVERKKSHHSQLSKSNCQYHKIFKEISKEEQLRQSYPCALQKDILYQGRMFVSDHWICFHSKVFGKDTKIAIPVMSVTHVKKTKTAILVPNALVIATANDREKSPCSSPIPSSAENSFRGQRSPRSPHFPLSFPGDFSDLDRAVRQRRPDMEESSSSDSQTPDYEKIAEFSVPPFLDVLKHTESKAPPEHPDRQLKVKNQHQNQHISDNKQHDTHNTEVLINSRASLKTVLFVYLLLVCVLVLSSCYLAFKIISLEQRLTTLGSISEFAHQGSDVLQSSDVNTQLFTELLTINLMKLEKVQRNLQRLLDEAA